MVAALSYFFQHRVWGGAPLLTIQKVQRLLRQKVKDKPSQLVGKWVGIAPAAKRDRSDLDLV